MQPPRSDPWTVRGYHRSRTWLTHWTRLSEGIFDGIWLGLLDRDDLRRVDHDWYVSTTEPVRGTERRYVDPEHILSGLSNWEAEAVGAFPPDGTVVVTSAGAGREVHGLAELGFDVNGFEPNSALVMAGREVLADPSRLKGCAYDEFPPCDGTADAVVVGWGSYMLLAGRDTRIELLRGAARVLPTRGLLLVSYFDRPTTRYFGVVRRVGGFVRRLRRRPALEHGDALSPNFVHYFAPSEVAAELDAAGFDVVRQVRAPYGHTLARRR